MPGAVFVGSTECFHSSSFFLLRQILISIVIIVGDAMPCLVLRSVVTVPVYLPRRL